MALRPLLGVLLLGLAGASCGVTKAGSGPDAAADRATDTSQPADLDGGSDGSAATTADAGVVPACAAATVAPLEATGYVRDEAGNLVSDALDESVVVMRFEEAMITTPPGTRGLPGYRLLVESTIAPHPRWELQVLIPGLPADLVKQWDPVRMVVTAKPPGAFAPHTVSQTLVLTGVDGLILFTSNLWAGANALPAGSDIPSTLSFDLFPDLSPWGIDLGDAGPSCVSRQPADVCPLVRRRMAATRMGKSGTAGGGETLDLGALHLAVGRADQFLSAGGCDGFSNTRLAGFVGAASVKPDGGAGDGAITDAMTDAISDATSDTSSGLAACATFSSRRPGGAGCVLNAEGQFENPPPGTLVQITSAADAMATCDSSAAAASLRVFRRFGAQSPDGRAWQILVDVPELPAALVTVGDTFALTVKSSVEPAFFGSHIHETVVLSRGGNLALFTSSLFRVAANARPGTTLAPFDLFPELSSWGLGLADGGATCQTPPGSFMPCGYASHKVRATWQGREGTTDAAGRVVLGTLTLRAGMHELLSVGNCDGLSAADLTGFVVAAP